MSQQEVIDYLKKENKPKTANEIKGALDKAEATTQRILRQLTREGILHREKVENSNHHYKKFVYSINENA